MKIPSIVRPEELELLALAAARAAAAVLMRRFSAPDLATEAKGERLDIVTDADIAAEAAIRRVIADARGGDGFIGEESVAEESRTGYTWIVDPLDSTANFARGIPHWAVSIAVDDPAGTVAAVVANPPLAETFSMHRGGELRLNGTALPPVTPVGDLANALAVVGWDHRMGEARAALVARTLLPHVGKVRGPGSPALGLAWTAAGRADLAYYEQPFADWDIAAGTFFCRERGFTATFKHSRDGTPHRLLVVPRTLADQRELQRLLD